MSFIQTYREDFKKNLSLAWPMMVAQLGQVTVNFIDNIMVGRLGAESLAAVSLSVAVYISLVVAGMGLSFALPPLVASAHGANETRSISQYFKHSLIINVVYALLCAILIEILFIPILPSLGQAPEVVELARPYLRISGWTMIPLMFFQTLRCYSDGMSETKPAMVAILIGNILNIIFNYMLIFGKWGAPQLGVTGAAIGSLVARILMIGLFLIILYRWKDLWHYFASAQYFQYQKKLFIKTLKLGIPTGLQMFFEVSAFGGAALIMGTLGAVPQAAHQIAINLASITFLICTGMGMAATIRVGNQKGKNNIIGMRNAGASALVQVGLFMLLSAFLFVVFRYQLPLIYIEDKEVIVIAATLLLMAAIFQVSDGVQVVALGALRGLQDVLVPSVITFVAYWIIGLPTSFIAVRYFDVGPVGVWLGLVLGLTISAGLLTMRFINRTRIKA